MITATQIALDHGLHSLTHLRAVEILHHSPHRLTATELASLLQLTTAGITNLADTLVSHRLARRVSVAGDRRKQHLVLTRKGREMIQSMILLSHPHHEDHPSPLTTTASISG